VKWSKGFSGSMSTAALLLPLVVAADSHIRTESASAAAVATTHLDFKIVVPTVLSLHVGGANDRTSGAETVAIMSNGRNVTMSATVRTPEPHVHARGSVILNASARKVIAQDAMCAVGDVPVTSAAPSTGGPANADIRRAVCTVSMP
jgi:hypothetical protein